MQDASYDAAAYLTALADARTAEQGQRILDAAHELRRAVIDCLEEWEDEYDAGDSFRRPQNFPEVWRLVDLAGEAQKLTAAVRRHRDLSYVLATAEAA